jgi:hypothetical protein
MTVCLTYLRGLEVAELKEENISFQSSNHLQHLLNRILI